MNRKHFSEQMATLSIAFRTEITKPLTDVYWMALKSYSDGAISIASVAYIRTGKFFPRVADLIELIEGTSQANAHEAWAKALLELRDSANAKFDAKTAEAIAAIGGAEYLGTMSYRDLEFKKKDFIAIYESLDDSDPTPRIETGKSQIGMVNELVKKVTDDSARNSDDENDKDP